MPKHIEPGKLINIFPPFNPIRVKYKDIFDLKGFYETLFEYLKEHGWDDGKGGVEHWESYYGERIDQSGAKEIWMNWRLAKDADGAPLKYYLDFTWHCIAISKAEIVRNGQKLSMNKGEVELKIWAFIEKKYEGAFNQHSFLKMFTNIFTKRIYRKALEARKKELYQETYALQNFIKQWFKLKRYLPYEETKNFYPSAAYPSHIKE